MLSFSTGTSGFLGPVAADRTQHDGARKLSSPRPHLRHLRPYGVDSRSLSTLAGLGHAAAVRSERVFTIEGATAVPASSVSLAGARLRERGHLQAWVLVHPEILGDDLLIITEEFDRWTTGTGESDNDRLDVLAADREGRLVVAEPKRGRAPGGVLHQVLNYGARVSRFSLDDLDEGFAHYLGTQATPEQAAARLRDQAPTISDESLALGLRLVVLASEFPPAVTNTAMYLLGYGVPLTLLRFELYRTSSKQLILTTSPQPGPDRADRPVQQRRDPAVPTTSGLRRQGRTDHGRSVRAPQQQQLRQQHVRARATRTERTTRTHDHDLGQFPDAPRPGPAPRPQHLFTTRTSQQALEQ